MKECSVNLLERIYIKKEYLVCHTLCNQIVKIRFKKYSLIRPEVAIKYFKCIARRFGNYAVDKEVVRISKESKLLLERIAHKELSSTGILMSNLKINGFARISCITENKCGCNECLEKERRVLAIKEYSLDGYSYEDFKNIISLIKKNEKIKTKIMQQMQQYNKYGVRTTREVYDRFFGCYNLKEKRAGIRPFIQKGPWTKESANKLIHSYKTAMSIREMSFFVILYKTCHPSANFIMYNNTQIYYTLIIHKIDLKTKYELRQYIKNKIHKK
ncbi:hypothetical protein NEPAR06_1580 [Nematocida parisii]|uniref:Uncharacterized protein n=1 Tax=Nematocida parisii (strain ERTm3) TaxID=935791 RepID=I3EH35_NEMP3|nr:uncharacterized protein NEPG_00306 [Nematocida parisii ERTm1]EIJ88532.1 hypothetical protein NEQG_01222 [Nematocida parisii ERTm3]KAI5127797.1 hypothetical protein NEPAR08_1048 [Nematocida parisii]EIJ94782.1 hypothetical protein NEPG_00306 [Nematocida parisii ERTm1]KAI5128224.1 hypothetical protein NEPAR03_1232 [Nematocida parisii]KAI5142392.1 hypothetical protein NEPAR04_1511 [Nematocida parisii]|eukprot:XP_013058138.1 hypothetical protein NEPG_00306 [Nematocida parisii ERTm1]